MKETILSLFAIVMLGFYLNNPVADELDPIRDLYKQAEYVAALELSNKTLNSLDENAKQELRVDLLTLQSASMVMLHDYKAALQQLEQAEQILSSAQNTRRFKVWNLQIKAYLAIGDCVTTKKLIDQVLAEFEGKDTSNELAHTYAYLGTYWGELGDDQQAEQYFRKAHSLRVQNAEQDPLGLYETAEYLALVKHAAGDHESAIKISLDALDVLDKHQGSYFQRASIFRDLGAGYREQGDGETAIQYLEAAKDLLIEHAEDAPIKLAKCYHALAATYREAEDFEAAETHFQLAKEIFESDQRLAFRNSLGFMLHDYALLKLRQEQFDHAEELLTQASKLIKSDFPSCGWFTNQTTQIRSTRADLIYYRKRYDEAILEYKRIINLIKTELGEESTFLLQPYNNLGLTYRSLSQFDSAMVYYDKGLDLIHPKWRQLDAFEEAIRPGDFAYLLWNKAENQYWNFNAGASLDSLRSSFAYYDAYARFLDYMRGSYLEEASKIGFANINKVAYEKCIGVLLILHQLEPKVGWDRKAFQYLEKSKSLVLLEAVNRSRVKRFKNISTELVEEESRLRGLALAAENRYQNLLNRLDPDDSTVRKAKAESFQQKKVFYNLLDRMERDYPDYHRMMHQTEVQTLEEVQGGLSGPEQAILSYYEGNSNIYIFLITQDGFSHGVVRRDFPLTALIDEFRTSITAYHGIPLGMRRDSIYQASLGKYVKSAQTLYRKLVAPIEDELTGIKELIIVPDGHIANIPFAALLSDQPGSIGRFDTYPFLLKEFRFSYCYSSSMLKEMTQRDFGKGRNDGVLGFAPFYPLDTISTGSADVAFRRSFADLKYSKEAVDFAVKQEGGLALIQKEATKDRFIKDGSKYRILHLSTHAIADAKNGAQSYLAFYHPTDHERLYVRELYGHNLQADLVVLSACETNLGQLEIGEGIISLARAFAYAGAKSILTTLWVVEDAATKDLAINIYKNLKEPGTGKVMAIHDAKLAHVRLSDNTRKHPFFWAAMIGVGDMSPLHP